MAIDGKTKKENKKEVEGFIVEICLELERLGIDFQWNGIDPIGKDANGIEIASRACVARAETPMSKNGSWIYSPTSGRRSDIVGDVELDLDGAE
ncbi:hypothetical protein M569_14014 [Genlisea aurea]|uniref:Uncharacterized protein n=1 Tax=Genlisea aurea TaxID=192259 RepID=S8DMF6_9LAMI|nr:hypothetical protein M569_14014 [Genlisea aurea]